MENWHKTTLSFQTQGKGLYPITEKIQTLVRQSGAGEGLCFLFLPHCSASLCINESYDPSARADMEAFLEHLVPENQAWMRHTLEGGDDSSSHLRALMLPTSLTIPIAGGRLTLGDWQGIYIYEHRRSHQLREVEVRILGMPAS